MVAREVPANWRQAAELLCRWGHKVEITWHAKPVLFEGYAPKHWSWTVDGRGPLYLVGWLEDKSAETIAEALGARSR